MLTLAVFAAALAAAAPDCAVDAEPMMAMPLRAFEDTPQGWRMVARKPGCEGAAADLIAAYRTRHAATLHPSWIEGLAWHEGQLRATVGDYERAIPLLSQNLQSQYEENRVYAEATLAFLKKDRAALLDARARLAALPRGPDVAAETARNRAQVDRDPSRPINLIVVDALIACFDKSYDEAYGWACRRAG